MKKIVTALALVTAFTAAPAFAQFAKDSFYAGFGVGRGNLNISGQDLTGLNNASVGDSATTYTVRAGWRFHPNLAVEAGYYDLGEYDFQGGAGSGTVTGTAKAKSVGLSLVGIAPLSPAFDLYARIGVEQSELKVNASSNITPGNADLADKQTGATYGVGGRWNFTRNVGVFAEWMKNDKIEVDSYLVGIDFRF
jgi:OmpA-OmpF porin, OOP family